MAQTNAQIVLAAVQAAIDANVPYIHLLSQRHKLKPELVLRILLTFLPESTEPAVYIPLLKELNGDGSGLPESLAEASEDKDKGKERASPEEARRRVKALRLLRLEVTDDIEAAPADGLTANLTAFLLLRARRIDSETGALPLVQQLLEPFVEQSAYLKLWLGSTILPLLRINYEFFPEREDPITLEDFEALRGGVALDTLVGGGVGGSASAGDYIRDLKQVVGPWLYGEIYRRRRRQRRPSNANSSAEESSENAPLACWSWVNNWLMHIASKQPAVALDIARSATWSGPGDIDDGGWIGQDPSIMTWVWKAPQQADSSLFKATRQSYLRTCLCLFYTTADTSEETLDALEELLLKIAETEGHEDMVRTILHDFDREGQDSVLPAEFLNAAQGRAHRLHPVELAEDSHPLSSLDATSFSLAAHLLRNTRLLQELKQQLPISRVLHMSLLGTANEQRILLQRVVQNIEGKDISDDDCDEIRAKLLDLSKNPKSSDQQQPRGVFGKVFSENEEELDLLVLKSEIVSARYRHVISTYLNGSVQRLPHAKVEETVVQVALATYDNASNGNRTRGGVKKVSDIVTAFKPSFPSSQSFKEIEALIRSTHALSFYKLTLQNGVPCVPVNIRVHPQPLTLIDKVLSQNKESYAQLDNLISIAEDFVRAGLVKSTDEHSQDVSPPASQDVLAAAVQRQVIAKAISAALEEGDFDTAYSYITTRLSSHASANEDDDILWRAAYAAGRAPPPNSSGPRHLRRLEQKMELLSQALALAPPSALTDVLSTWQKCETQVNEAIAAEVEADKSWNDQGDTRAAGDRHLPGGFGAEAYIHNAEGAGGRQLRAGRGQEEAPMGLFDVARAAGSALQKSAFPLGGAGRGQPAQAAAGGSDDGQADGQRVRKRDMVSNAVTTGLVSGIGWVIGATPARDG